MKKLLIALLLLGSTAHAELTDIHKSSNIAAANSTGYLAAGYLDKIIVSMATSGGVLELYNSTFTTSVLIASCSLAAVTNHNFSNSEVKGLFWRTSSNTNGVQIIYKTR